MNMNRFAALLLSLVMVTAMLSGCAAPAKQPEAVRAVAMKGATGMGMARFMEQAESGALTDNDYDFSIVAAIDEVTALLAKGEADIAALPANVSSVLYNNMGGVSVLAINTLGVLYIVETGESISSVSDLRGRTIYASGKGATPEYALNYILTKNGIDPETDVDIQWKAEQTECLSALLAEENAIAMLPEPFVTTAKGKSGRLRTALDLTREWDAVAEESSGLLTGVVVARDEFIQSSPEAVSAFMEHYKESVEYVNSNVEDTARIIGGYGIVTEEVARAAIPSCNIVFIEGAEMKDKLSGYLAALYGQNPASVGGALPGDDFYYSR